MGGSLPRIGVVIPAYKAEAFVARAIRSALDQPGVAAEVVVVVDGRFDRTEEIARGFPGVKVLVNDTNRGVSAARNRGLAAVDAPMVWFLDADDWAEGRLLEGLAEALMRGGSDLAFGPQAEVFDDGRRIERPPARWDPARPPLAQVMHGGFPTPSAVLWRTAFLRRIGGWSETVRRSEDFEILVRALLLDGALGRSELGFGIWYQYISPNRTTAWFQPEKFSQGPETLRAMIELARTQGALDAELSEAFLRLAYSHLRDHARYADLAAYRRSRQLWREMGGRRHEGSRLHRLAVALLGLRAKERLSTLLLRARRRLGAI